LHERQRIDPNGRFFFGPGLPFESDFGLPVFSGSGFNSGDRDGGSVVLIGDCGAEFLLGLNFEKADFAIEREKDVSSIVMDGD